jgi:hypothetical protein
VCVFLKVLWISCLCNFKFSPLVSKEWIAIRKDDDIFFNIVATASFFLNGKIKLAT